MKSSLTPDIDAVKHRDAKAKARAIKQQVAETLRAPTTEVVVLSLSDEYLVELGNAYNRFNAACLDNNHLAIVEIGEELNQLWQEALKHDLVTVVERK